LTKGEDIRPARRRPVRSRFSRGATQLTGLLATVGVLFLIVLITVLLAYAARREIARQALIGWLEDRGIQAEVQFERFDPNGLVASIRAGDPDDPDLVVERAEIDYRLGMPWSGGFSVRPTRIRLVRPEVRATLVEGRLGFGALDPVIEEFTGRPPSPSQTGPNVTVEGGRFRLATRGGAMVAIADARLENNRLIRLDARVPSARLRDDALTLDLDRAGVAVRTVGGRTALAATVHLDQVAGAGLSVDSGQVRLRIEAPYPEMARRRVHGPVEAHLRAAFDGLGWQGGAARDVDADLTFDGRGTGWIEAFALLGGLSGQVTADRLDAGGARLTRAALVLEGERVRLSRRDEVRWRYEGDVRLGTASAVRDSLSGQAISIRLTDLVAGGAGSAAEARGRLDLDAAALSQDALTLTGVSGEFGLDSRLSGAGLTRLSGAARSTGGSWSVLGPVGAGDVPEQTVLKRAFQAFAFEAPALTVSTGPAGTEVSLDRPARVRPATGGEVVIAARRSQLLYAAAPGRPGGGAMVLQASGGGLPQARIDVPRYVMARGEIAAALDGEAAFDFGLARGARLSAAGMLRIGGGRTTFSPAGCFPFSAALLELGENDVAQVSASLCPTQGPMLTIADGWRFEAQARRLSAAAPFLGMAASEVSARVTARDPGGALSIATTITDALISDTEPAPRFHPLGGSGHISLADEAWSGVLHLRERTRGLRVADVTIRHAGRTGAGGAQFDATGLQFAPGGLQPAQVSPLAGRFMGDGVSGRADFTGSFDWTAEGATSGGRFATPGLDFVSPLGAVTQLSGDVIFVSLTPLITAPDQHLAIGGIEAFLPLTNVTLDLGLDEASLRVAGGRVAVAGGFARLEPVNIPFDPEQVWEGVLVLEQVQLGDVFAASNFSDAVQLDAVVSGRLPFIYGPNGVTVVEGEVSAVQPGRLSIARAALTGMSAGGGGEQVPPNTVQDFAYQALENLWFDQLDAELNSLPQGRLGVLFTIHGRHDPPVDQEIRLGLVELLRRDFLNRVLPLPSRTEINLTLDSSFNLDQLIADLMEIQRARNVSERSQ